MEREVQDRTGCTTDQQKQQQTTEEQRNGEQLVDVLLNQKAVEAEDVSDREIRSLCLLPSDHPHAGDSVSETTTTTSDAANDLILVESTSSSPILTGPGIIGQQPQLVESVAARVFVREEHQISASTPDDGDEEEAEEKDVDAELGTDKGEQTEEEEDGVQKSGLSRCVATGNSADEVETTSVTEKGREVEECTCHDNNNSDDVEESSAKCNQVLMVDSANRDDDQCSSYSDQDHDSCEMMEVAIGSEYNISNGVQSEQAAQDKEQKQHSEAKETQRLVVVGESDEADHSCDSAPTLDILIASTTTTTAPSSSVLNDDDPSFYSVVNDSGGSSQSQSTKQTPVVANGSSSSSGGSSTVTHSNCSNSVVTKQQTPTSVRTANTVAGSGSFGKSEQQLENPKILSKRLQQLFRANQCSEEDNNVCKNESENNNKSETVKMIATPSMMDTNDNDSGSSSSSSSSSRVANGAEETPSSSLTSSIRLDTTINATTTTDPLVKQEVKQECEDVEDEEQAVLEEEEDQEMAVPNADGVVVIPENSQARPQHPLPLQDFDPETAWNDCEEVGDESEEICTCQNYSDTEDAYDEDEQLPSKDVDLSGFTTHDLLQESENGTQTATGANGSNSVSTGSVTTPLGPGRKRKISEAGSTTSAMDSPCSSVQLYGCSGLDVIQSKRCRGGKYSSTGLGSPKTPTSSVAQIPAFLRTPRSAQSMHLMPREHLPQEMGTWLGQFQKWTEFDRVTALNHIIDLCEPSQVRHVMKVIEPQFQRDFISLLPRELALQVLSYLDPTDLLRAAQTCRNWRFLCDDNLLWKDKCKEGNIIIDVESDRPKRGRAGNMPPIASPWKAAYMRQHIIEMNWRSRPIRQPKVLKGHDDHVITCLQFCGNRIVSGSDDNTLKVWSAVTGKCLRVLVGHTGGVWSSQMSSKYIISGSTDRTLKVWNADTGHCEHTLYGHTSTVRCMHLHGEKVVSGSRDATLRVWDVNRGNCLHVLVGHLAAVRCVQYDGKLVVSGAYDYTVKVWNPERQECLHTLQGHTNRVYSLQFDGIHVVSGSLDTSIRVWDAETGSCKHTLMGHQSLTSGMELRDHILVSGNADSTVKIWDIVSGQCLQTLSGPNKHQSAVTCLQFNSRFVITSSDDGTVKLWDVKTGEFIRNLVALDSGGSGGVVWRIRASDTKLICAVGSRNGTEETKLMVLDFDVEGACLKCS